MSKSSPQPFFKFGRVFFPGEPKVVPDQILFQPLGNHVGNVRRLAQKWKDDNFSLEGVIEGINLHDKAKPQTFKILVETNKKEEFTKYIYSFKGHRFKVDKPQNLWAQALARGHHDYSTREIIKDTYQLKKDPNYQEILTQDPLRYAKELYILEMCDQIEAELACRVIGDDEQAKSRTFMDFTITEGTSEDNNHRVFKLDPYPFKEPNITLNFRSWTYNLSDEDKNQLQQLHENGKDKELGSKLNTLVREWWKKNEHNINEDPAITAIIKPSTSNTYSPSEKSENAIFWYRELANFQPNPMQEEVFQTMVETKHPAFILKAPTGVGKFEAIIIPFLARLSTKEDRHRLIIPLPARSLLEDQKERCEKYLKRFSLLHKGREVSLVIDTGSEMNRYVYLDGKELKSSNNPRRHLYKGDIVLTTIDKFMYRYFGYGDKQKSFIFPYRIHHGNTLICFDEAHTYDDISFTNFCRLVKALYEAGRSLVLMTATLPQNHLERFDYLADNVIDYIDVQDNLEKLNNFHKQILKQDYSNLKQFEWANDIVYDVKEPTNFQQKLTSVALKEWNYNPNHRIIVSVETVKDAIAIYEKIKQILNIKSSEQNEFLFLYHGRLSDIPKTSRYSRTKLYQRLKERDEKDQAYILVTTSAIEVGCDLNSTRLVTQLCNPESLIQRAGRCNRKGDVEDAKIIVVGNNIPEFVNTLSETELEDYQTTLNDLHAQNFDPKAILNCVSTKQTIDDYRVVELFSMLQDYVYNTDLTCQSAHEKGLVITRSWTPSVTLVYDDGNQGDNLEEMIKKSPQIQVPIDRLILKKNDEGNYINQYANVDVYEWIYNKEETRYKLEPLKYWGCAYSKDMVIKVRAVQDGAISDSFESYSYDHELGFKDLPGVFIKWRANGYEERLQYKPTKDRSVIINYTKALTQD
jgi:CRISPR-associated endonuclease/helicase Cas3